MRFEPKRILQYLLASGLATFAALGMAQAPDEALEPVLQVVRLDLLDSFANYAIDPESEFAPGDVVNTAFNLKDYAVSEDYRIKVRWMITTSGPTGLPFAPGKEGVFDAELAPQDENWQPLVRFAAEIPNHAPSGTYRINVEAVDELAETTTTSSVDVHVTGGNVAHSDVLTVQNFTFSLTEGGSPVQELVYHPGSTMYSSFDITGFELGEGNSYEIASELELFDVEGASVYSFNPASEKGSSFYPRLSVPARFHFDLDPTMETGHYSLFLTVTDVVGRQSYSVRRLFEVR